MKNLILIVSLFLTSCWGGSRKMKTPELIVITEIKQNTYIFPNNTPDIYCKYFGNKTGFERNFKFIDTCGKFKIGDTVAVNFYKY